MCMFCLIRNIQLFCFMSEIRGEIMTELLPASIMNSLTQWVFSLANRNLLKDYLSDFKKKNALISVTNTKSQHVCMNFPKPE